jgi:hypothetical protein
MSGIFDEYSKSFLNVGFYKIDVVGAVAAPPRSWIMTSSNLPGLSAEQDEVDGIAIQQGVTSMPAFFVYRVRHAPGRKMGTL